MQFNRLVCDTEFPPVTEAASWVAGRQFPESLPLIDVSQAVPGYPTSSAILEHMSQELLTPATSKYGHALGLPALRHAYAKQLDSASVTTDNVAVTAGCNQAFYVAVAALCEPGDEVILPSPWYFNHKMSLDMLGINAVALACDADNEMIPVAENARALITPRTRAIVLISPNNPTGQVYPPDTIDAFYQLCRETSVPLLIDETYCDFRETPDKPAHHIFDHSDWADHAIHLYSFSKSYALAGYRVGALVASEQCLREATKVLDCVSICAPQISQQAAAFGIRNAADWKEDKRVLMYSRASAFKEALGKTNHGYEVTAIGAYFAYLKHPYENLPATTVARYLADHANLLCLPGEMFGPEQQRYLRVAFANVSQDAMPEIANRLAKFQPG